MKLGTWGLAALGLALCASIAGAAQPTAHTHPQAEMMQSRPPAEGQEDEVQPGDFAKQLDQAESSSYGDCGQCQTATCGGGKDGFGGLMSRPLQLVFGAQYILARADFSEALAYVEQNPVAGGDTFHQFKFDYNSSYSFYGGVYLCDCGGAVVFNYTRLTSDGDFTADNTQFATVFSPYEVNNHIIGHASADLKSYDLSFAKTIPLGCPLECGKPCHDCCETGDKCASDSCCSASPGCGSGCCGCRWCPAWDITWTGGVRFADVGWARGVTEIDPANSNAFVDSSNTTMSFSGFGGHVGLIGRRYIGKRGLFSLYAKGDWSALVGDVDIRTIVTNNSGQAFTTTRSTNLIPVTEIELGGTAHLGSHAAVSAGYFWAAWHDLGMRDEYDFNRFQTSHYDDANILGFDGLFARVEVTF